MMNREKDTVKQKKELRSLMKIIRAEKAKEEESEEDLLANFLCLEREIKPKTSRAGARLNYFVYLSYSSEAPTDKLITTLLENGNGVYCPRIEGKSMAVVPFSEETSLSVYGIREPLGEAYEGELDCIIVPLLAVDRNGNRLGYGGGFYDRFFKKYAKAKRIAYCYDFQIVNDIPTEAFDEKVDIIVTDKQIIKINER